MKQYKALVLGTNAGQADLIRYLKSINCEVHSCGFKRIGPGCDLADYFHLVDIVNNSAVANLASIIQPDIIYSVSSDIAIKTVTHVSEELGLPHLLNSEIIDLFDHKEALRAFLNENNISTVQYTTVKCEKDAMSWNIFPCVVKPVDSQGQRGVVLVESSEMLEIAVRNALKISKSEVAIIEEYLSGVEFSSHVVVQNYKLLVNELTERYVHGAKYFGLPKGHAIPIRHISSDIQECAKNMVQKLVDRLKIKDAILYIQMVSTENGPKIIEVAPRLDGCHIWRLIELSKGYNLIEYAVKCLTGDKIIHHERAGKNCSLYFLQQLCGTKFDANNFDIPSDTKYLEFRYVNGDEITAINGKLEVVGYYVIEN